MAALLAILKMPCLRKRTLKGDEPLEVDSIIMPRNKMLATLASSSAALNQTSL